MKFSRSFSMFRNIKRDANTFNYRSRFYDSEKEDKEKRRKSMELELNREEREGKSISFARTGDRDWIKQTYRKQAFNSNIILIIILLILCLISLAVINYLGTVHV